MKKWPLILIFITLIIACSLGSIASTHIALNLKNEGLKNILFSALTHYRAGGKKTIVILDEESFVGVVPKRHINNNPIIKKLNEYVEIAFDKDLKFHVKWSPITVEAKMSETKTQIEALGRKRHFEMAFKVEVDHLLIKGEKIEFCEFENDDKERSCNKKDGFYGRFENFELLMKPSEVIQALIKTSIKIDDGKVKIEFNKMISNLIGNKSKLDKLYMTKFNIIDTAPKFWLNFEEFHIPPPVLIINGTRVELDTSDIKETLLLEREFLAGMLTRFAGEFVAQDLVEIANTKIISKIDEIKTKYELIDYDLYASSPDHMSFIEENKQDDIVKSPLFEKLSKIFRKTIYQTKNNLIFSEIKTYQGLDLAVHFNSELTVNEKRVPVGKFIWNGQRVLKPLDFSQIKTPYQFAFSMSEPLLNSFSKSAINTGLVNELFQEIVDMPGVYIDGLNFHFMHSNEEAGCCEKNRLKLVVNMRVRLSELKREDWLDSVQYKLGEYLEGDGIIFNTERDLFFPLEVDFDLNLYEEGGQVMIDLLAEAPFYLNKLRNTFNYPYKNMTYPVQRALYKRIRTTLRSHINKKHTINITDYVNTIPGVVLAPRDIFPSRRGHLILTFDILGIDLEELGSLGEK